MNKEMEQLLKLLKVECPFTLAKQFNVKIHYFDFNSEIYGYYTKIMDSNQIVLHSEVPLEVQEKLCEHLLYHHIVSPKLDICIDKQEYEELERAKNLLSYNALMEKFRGAAPKAKLSFN